MDITINVTKWFNSIINHNCFFDSATMKPVLFLKFDDNVKGDYQLEIMNFGLNLNNSLELENQFMDYKQYCEDIINCKYEYKSIMIFGKAVLRFKEIKGGDILFCNLIDKFLSESKVYYQWPYTLEKGDFCFSCGGYSAFSPHYILLNLIASKNAKVTLTFSSDEYVLMDSSDHEFENQVSHMQSDYRYSEPSECNEILNKCTNIVGKTFNHSFKNKYLKQYFRDGFNTLRAVENEEK